RAANLVVTADDRVELALLRALRQVDGVLLQRLARFLGIGVGHLLATPQLVDGALDRTAYRSGLLHDRFQRRAVVHRREHDELARDVLVVALLRQAVGEVEETVQVVADVHVAAGTLHPRQAIHRFAELRAQQVDVHARLGEQAAYARALLV